jgi:ubiquinone/menaquinone biosynthesis C-methylase UbiE
MSEPATETDLFSFDPFSHHPFYLAVNRSLVERAVDSLPSGGRPTVVDLGCGTGTITEMIVSALRARRIEATVIAVEPSPDALAQARHRLADAELPVRLVQGDAADLGSLGDSVDVDALFFCNAIHLVHDKAQTVRLIAQAVRPGGVVAINSTFFSGAYVADTERFYRMWTVRAMRWLRREHPEALVSRERAEAMRWLSGEEYAAMLTEAGLDTEYCEHEQAEMTLASFQDIGRYRLFIEGALPGVPITLGAQALHQAAEDAFAELNLVTVPRNWLQIVARRAL